MIFVKLVKFWGDKSFNKSFTSIYYYKFLMDKGLTDNLSTNNENKMDTLLENMYTFWSDIILKEKPTVLSLIKLKCSLL